VAEEESRSGGAGATKTAGTIRFPDGGVARAVDADATTAAGAILAALELDGRRDRPVIVVFGGADELTGRHYAIADALLGAAVPEAARRAGATVIDGGTDAGVMRILGRARVRDASALPVLLGVAPRDLVAIPGEPPSEGASLEPNHTHFVLTAGTHWGDESPRLADLAQTLAGDAPVIALIAGGGPRTFLEAALAAQRGWPVFLLEQTGGAARELARRWRRHREWRVRRAAFALPYRWRYRRRPPVEEIDDPAVREVVARGDVRIESGKAGARLAARLVWEAGSRPVLTGAWHRFAAYDALAAGLRRAFERSLVVILALGALAALAGLLEDATGRRALHWAAVAIPVIGSVLIAVSNRRASGPRWVLLRAAAESIKSEIFRYRTQTPPYDDAATRDRELARRVNLASSGLLRTEASSAPLSAHYGPMPPEMYGSAAWDDGLAALDADAYLRVRVDAQLEYYHGRVRGLDRRRGKLLVGAIAAGGAGAFLAAVGVEAWIGLTSTVAAAIFGYLGNLQFDSTIVSYNQAAGRLDALRDDWTARPQSARSPTDLAALVDGVESTLITELGGWVQQMDSSLKDLERDRASRAEGVDPAASGSSAAGPGH
jgi:hypothetical protein